MEGKCGDNILNEGFLSRVKIIYFRSLKVISVNIVLKHCNNFVV